MQTTKKSLFKKEDLTLLKESVDIFYLFEQLGISYNKVSRREIRGACSIHGGDNKTAFRFNLEKRTWVCFTHKCHEFYGSDILGLIMAKLKCDFKSALDFLKELVGDISGAEVSYVKRKQAFNRNSFVDTYAAPEKPDYVSEESLALFKPLRSKFFSKEKNGGFNKQTLDHFEVAGGFVDSCGIVRDIIPIRTENNELVAYSLRDISAIVVDDDYKYILTPGFQKDKVLYNLNNARLFCTRCPLILVEGFKSVWKLYEYGIYNVIAVMGSEVTQGQAELLKAYALKGVVLFFDPDKAGIEGIASSLNILNGAIPVDVVLMNEKDGEDPAELSFNKAYEYLGYYVK